MSKAKNIKWFKHYGSLGERDFSQELIEKHGLQAYARYILLLETCTLLHGDNLGGTYVVSAKVLCRRLGCKRQNLGRTLGELGVLMGFTSVVGQYNVEICMPILLELLNSDSAGWKQRHSEKTKKPSLDKEEDKEEDKELELEKEEDKELNTVVTNSANGVSVTTEPVHFLAPKLVKKQNTDLNRRIWESYEKAYLTRWGKSPVRNAKVNKNISDLGRRLGEDAVAVVEFFVNHNKGFYVENTHSLGICLKDAESLHTQWTLNRPITRNDVLRVESMDHYASQIRRIERGEI